MANFALGLLLWLASTFLLAGAWFGGRSLANRLLGPRPRGMQAVDGRANDSRKWRHVGHLVGPLAAYLACSVVALVSLVLYGAPTPSLVVDVLPESPAERAGLISGDRILIIDSAPVHTWEEALAALRKRPAQAVPILVERGQQEVSLVATTTERGRLGINGREVNTPITLGTATMRALAKPAWVVKDSLVGLTRGLTGAEDVKVAGIGDVGREASRARDAQALLGFFGLLASYILPGVWLLEATYWRATLAQPAAAGTVALASRSRRLLAASIDAVLLTLALILGGLVAIATGASDVVTTASMALAGLAWLTVQWLRVARTGQSFGKRWMNIRITRDDGSPARFARVIVVRSWVVPLVSLLGPLGSVIFFADPLAICRRDRRCIHDIWAGTIVVGMSDR